MAGQSSFLYRDISQNSEPGLIRRFVAGMKHALVAEHACSMPHNGEAGAHWQQSDSLDASYGDCDYVCPECGLFWKIRPTL